MSLSRINIRYKNMRDIAYEELKNAVIIGTLKPNELLSEEYLSDQLGIGRTPLREAIQLLVYNRWFVREKSRLKVSPINESDIINLFLIRERLEGLSAYQATKNVTDEFLLNLQKVLKEMSEAERRDDSNGVLKSGKNFHYLIIKQSKNQDLEEMISPVLEKITRYRHFGVSSVPGRSKSAVEEHEKIFNALKKGDANEAEIVAKKHIILSKESIIFSTNKIHLEREKE